MSLLQNILPSFACVTAPSAPAPAAKPIPTVKPTYEIKGNPDTYNVTVRLPGVTKDSLEITADEQQVRLIGRRVWRRPETWVPVYLESGDAVYELVLSHDGAIDTKKIGAELRDGVLRMTLPKPEAAKPLKIAVA